MDDPISTLDAQTRSKIVDKVIQGTLKRKTRILVTHAIEYARIADRVVVMNNGKIAQSGRLSDLVQDAYTASLFQKMADFQHSLELSGSSSLRLISERSARGSWFQASARSGPSLIHTLPSKRDILTARGLSGKDEAEARAQVTSSSYKQLFHLAGGQPMLFCIIAS